MYYSKRPAIILALCMSVLILFASCNSNNFNDCEAQVLKKFEDKRIDIPLAFPEDWVVDINILDGDTVAISAIDSTDIMNSEPRTLSLISMPSTLPYMSIQDSIFKSFRDPSLYQLTNSGQVEINSKEIRYQIIYSHSFDISSMIFPLECEDRLCTLDASLPGLHDDPEEFCFVASTLEYLIGKEN